MRGSDGKSGELFSYVDLEKRVRRDHPLRAIREMANGALALLSGDFAALYSGLSRPSIAPEKRPGSNRIGETMKSKILVTGDAGFVGNATTAT